MYLNVLKNFIVFSLCLALFACSKNAAWIRSSDSLSLLKQEEHYKFDGDFLNHYKKEIYINCLNQDTVIRLACIKLLIDDPSFYEYYEDSFSHLTDHEKLLGLFILFNKKKEDKAIPKFCFEWLLSEVKFNKPLDYFADFRASNNPKELRKYDLFFKIDGSKLIKKVQRNNLHLLVIKYGAKYKALIIDYERRINNKQEREIFEYIISSIDSLVK